MDSCSEKSRRGELDRVGSEEREFESDPEGENSDSSVLIEEKLRVEMKDSVEEKSPRRCWRMSSRASSSSEDFIMAMGIRERCGKKGNRFGTCVQVDIAEK